jgi:hypothetical protein
MPDVIAIAKFRYHSQKIRPGDKLKIKGSHVPILVKAKLVKEITPPVYQTRHMEAAQPTSRTVPELRADCAARGIELPKGYIPKSELTRLLSEK